MLTIHAPPLTCIHIDVAVYDLQQSFKDIFRNDTRKNDECESLNYPHDESAEDLLINLREENQKMFVTVWFQDYPNDPMQNKINQYVTETMCKLICSNHPNVVYTQADLSYSNRNAKSYADLARKLYIGKLSPQSLSYTTHFYKYSNPVLTGRMV